jgi:hypothetical protein
VNELPRFGFVEVLPLPNQGQWQLASPEVVDFPLLEVRAGV